MKIQIRSAQNVGKVQISRGKNLLTLFQAISDNVFHGLEQMQKHADLVRLFSLVGQWLGVTNTLALANLSTKRAKLLCRPWDLTHKIWPCLRPVC